MRGSDFQYPLNKEKHLYHFRESNTWRWTTSNKKKERENSLFIIKRSPSKESMLGFLIPSASWWVVPGGWWEVRIRANWIEPGLSTSQSSRDTEIIPQTLNATYSLQFSLVAQSSPILCDPMDCSTPGFPVLHQLLELTQTHVQWVSDAIQPSHPLSSPSPPAFNLSQQQGLFTWVSSSHQVAEVLEFQLQHQSFQWLFRTDFL